MNSLKTNNEYGNWLESLKEKIKQNQIKGIAKQVVSQLQNTDNQYLNRFFKIPWGHHILTILKLSKMLCVSVS